MTIGRWHSEIDRAEQRKSFSPRLSCLFFSLRLLLCFLTPVSQCSLPVDQMCLAGFAPVKTKAVKSVDSVALTGLVFPFSSDCPLSM